MKPKEVNKAFRLAEKILDERKTYKQCGFSDAVTLAHLVLRSKKEKEESK